MVKWINRWIRKNFCKNELNKGEMLILWKDIDDQIYGWNGSASNEKIALLKVSNCIREKKVSKLEQMVRVTKKIG
jgi:hypothetical protein